MLVVSYFKIKNLQQHIRIKRFKKISSIFMWLCSYGEFTHRELKLNQIKIKYKCV